MPYVPHNVSQAFPTLPPHVQQGIANSRFGMARQIPSPRPPQPPSAPQGPYGVIAFSRTSGLISCTWAYDTYAEAAHDAKGSDADMRVVAWGCNMFLAFACSPKHRAYGYGRGYSLRAAQRRALRKCRQWFGTTGVILLAFNTSDGYNLARG
jgi:hypothetical protein